MFPVLNEPCSWGGRDLMRRRDFIALLGGAAAWPLAARAQQPDKVRRIGVLMGFSEQDSEARRWVAAFEQKLASGVGLERGHRSADRISLAGRPAGSMLY